MFCVCACAGKNEERPAQSSSLPQPAGLGIAVVGIVRRLRWGIMRVSWQDSFTSGQCGFALAWNSQRKGILERLLVVTFYSILCIIYRAAFELRVTL